MAQWLRFQAPNAGGLGFTPGQGTRSLRVCMLQLKIPHTTTKIKDPECQNYDLAQPKKKNLNKKASALRGIQEDFFQSQGA